MVTVTDIPMRSRPTVALVRLHCGKANAIDESLLDTLENELERALEGGARAVVLTGYDRYFSAGLNLTGLPDTREGMRAFAERFDRGLLHLYQFPLPVVAAVNGHAVAGGCILLSACDLRIGAEGDYRIGVSEVEIGVAFPSVALALIQNAVHPSWTTEVILGARLMDPHEALRSGLLHELSEPEELIGRATTRAEQLAAKPQPAFQITKRALHAGVLRNVEWQQDDSNRHFVETWFSEPVRKRREAILDKRKGT
jgi:enoyl-CoA hydratase